MSEIPGAHKRTLMQMMKAVRVHQFGGLEAIVHEEVSRPEPAEG
jgi:hypothetical protein